MAAIATFTHRGEEVPIDAIANSAFTQIRENVLLSSSGVLQSEAENFASEQGALTEGLIRGFYKHAWPILMAQYPKIVAIEAEMEYKLDRCEECGGKGRRFLNNEPQGTPCDLCGGNGASYLFMTKPDLIVEDASGELVYLEYKSTSSKKDAWMNSWETAVQLHSSVMATEQTIGRRPAFVQIVGLYKGYESYGKQNSPFCYAYKRTGNPPFTQDQVQYEYKAGFKRFATWEMEGGVKAWVDGMPTNILADQFPLTAPIFVNEDLVQAFFNQRLTREEEIFAGVEAVKSFPELTKETLDDVFPQKFDQCTPSFGRGCMYKKLCHGGVSDPLSEGFEYRIPHHEQELRQFEDQ